jgi:hypothetical protein
MCYYVSKQRILKEGRGGNRKEEDNPFRTSRPEGGAWKGGPGEESIAAST